MLIPLRIVLNDQTSIITCLKQDEIMNDKINESTPCSINLDSSLTIREITGLMEELNKISLDKNELIFQAEQVERVDAAALQLLLGFYLFAIKEGKKITWHKPSETFCEAVKLLGLKDVINISLLST